MDTRNKSGYDEGEAFGHDRNERTGDAACVRTPGSPLARRPGRRQRASASPAKSMSVGFLHVVPFSCFVPLRSISPAAGRAVRRDPNSRVSCAGACARGRAPVGAGAVRAPDCPGASTRASQAQGAPHPLAESGAFRAGAKEQGKRPRERRLLPSEPYREAGSNVNSVSRNFSKFANRALFPVQSQKPSRSARSRYVRAWRAAMRAVRSGAKSSWPSATAMSSSSS